MQEIMREYGRAVITLCVTMLAFLVFGKIMVNGNVGFMEILKSRGALAEKNDTQFADAKETGLAIERKLPMITFLNTEVKSNTTRKAEDLFAAADAEGNEITPVILKVIDKNGRELQVENNQVTFLQQGEYQIVVKARDEKCAVARKLFCVPVGCR